MTQGNPVLHRNGHLKTSRGVNGCKVSFMFDTERIHNRPVVIIEPRHEISNNVVCATSKGSDQPAHMRSLIRAIASRLNIL